jgi:hypothetical protein
MKSAGDRSICGLVGGHVYIGHGRDRGHGRRYSAKVHPARAKQVTVSGRGGDDIGRLRNRCGRSNRSHDPWQT